ncbi:MAG TPA: alpha/beta hydrolase fold domain-containing protein, partial [Chlamydiales bacterium]|nr:alpha/beta hydrolase fold domain-containing protein [Chlamydiales bacterium]
RSQAQLEIPRQEQVVPAVVSTPAAAETVTKPIGYSAKKISSIVLPALEIELSKVQKGGRSKPTKPSVIIQPVLTPYLNVHTTGSAGKFGYHLFEFDKTKPYEIVSLAHNSVFDEKVVQLIEDAKKAGKNILFVEGGTAPSKPKGALSEIHIERMKGAILQENELRHLAQKSVAWPTTYADTTQQGEPLTLLVDPLFHRVGAVREVNIASTNGAIVNGVELRPGDVLQKPEDQKWIVYYCKNAATWEQERHFLAKLAKDVGANVLCCNYRGVGLSTGFPETEKHLIEDGDAALQYLLQQGVKPENVLLDGTSMGGAVAVHVAALHAESDQPIAVCNDRSFRSLYHTIEELIPVAGGLLADMAQAAGWSLDSASKIGILREKNVPIVVLYHPDDKMVKIQAAFVKGVVERMKLERTNRGKKSRVLPETVLQKKVEG